MLFLSPAAAEPFKVGVSIPLTGSFAEYGEAVRNGIEMAAADQPGLTAAVRFIYEDNAYDPKKAVGDMQKFADLDKVNLALVWGNEPALSVAPIAEQKRLPTVVIAQYPQASAGKKYVIRFINNGEQFSQALLDYLRLLKIKRIAVIKSELSFFNMLIDGLKQNRRDEEIELVDTFLPGETDFRSSILRLKSRSFDILGVYLSSPQVRQFFRQAAELNFRPRAFGATPFESSIVIADSLPYMEGAVYTHNAVTDWFRDKYVSRYANDMQLAYAANAYDFAVLTSRLFGSGDRVLTPLEVISAYSDAQSQNAASGAYHFVDSAAEGKHFEFDIVVRRITAGRAEEVYRANYGSAATK